MAGILLLGRITDTNQNARERSYNGSEMKTSPSSYNSVFIQSVAYSLSLTSTIVLCRCFNLNLSLITFVMGDESLDLDQPDLDQPWCLGSPRKANQIASAKA